MAVAYAECALPLSLRTRPHQTSLAVWSVPSPLRVGQAFRITVGAKSSGAYDLSGAAVRIDDSSAEVGRGQLGDAPWPGTSALYWTEIALTAPAESGTRIRSAAFAASEPALPHLGATGKFSFVVVEAPEHRLIVKVIESPSAISIEDAQIGLGPYRVATGSDGAATIEAPGGRYNLIVWKAAFEPDTRTVDLDADTLLEVELTPLPEEVKVWG